MHTLLLLTPLQAQISFQSNIISFFEIHLLFPHRIKKKKKIEVVENFKTIF